VSRSILIRVLSDKWMLGFESSMVVVGEDRCMRVGLVISGWWGGGWLVLVRKRVTAGCIAVYHGLRDACEL